MTALVLALAGLVPVGCRSDAGSKGSSQAAAGDRGPGVGIDLAWWAVGPNNPDLSPSQQGPSSPTMRAILDEYASRPLPVSHAMAEAWKGSGFRLVAVPVGELEGLRRRLHTVGAIQHQWIGQTTRWMEIARGPSWSRPVTVSLDSGDLTLPGGCVRLLMRCWVAPGEPGPDASPGRAVLRMDLVPQHVAEDTRLTLEKLLNPASGDAAPGAGAVFDRLAMEFTMSGDDALLIVPDNPRTPWRPSEPSTDWPVIGRGPTEAETLGPPTPGTLSLGESMLVQPGSPGFEANRVVVVLIPSVPRGFRLLGP